MRFVRWYHILLMGMTCILTGCTILQSSKFYPEKGDKHIDAVMEARSSCRCSQSKHYVPDPRYPILHDPRYIRLNFHFVNDSTGQRNHVGRKAWEYTYYLLENANAKLAENAKMNLPEGNDTPVYDVGLRFVLASDMSEEDGHAIYEAYETPDEAFYVNKGRNQNNYSKYLIKKYAIHTDSVLNVFVLGHHPDSIQSKTYHGGHTGISFGSSVKIAGVDDDGLEGWRSSTLLNHEVGHSLGLNHSWRKSDGCKDTPPHPNCWNKSNTPPCDGLVSNNVMDYNSLQLAFTPCQIGKIHKSLYYAEGRNRRFVIKDHCRYQASKSLIVSDSLMLDRAFDCKGDVIVKSGGYLRISCRLHMPENGMIIVEPGATLDLNGCRIHNDCGKQWEGIAVEQKNGKKGKVFFRENTKIEDVHTMPKFRPLSPN